MCSNKKKGTALLLVVIATSLLMLLATGMWRKFSLIFDLVVNREQYYKNYYLVKTAMSFGTKIVRDNFDLFETAAQQKKFPISLDFSFLKKKTAARESLFVFVDYLKQPKASSISKFYLKSELRINGKTSSQICCFLSRKKNKDKSDKTFENYEYLVSNYTIGRFL